MQSLSIIYNYDHKVQAGRWKEGYFLTSTPGTPTVHILIKSRERDYRQYLSHAVLKISLAQKKPRNAVNVLKLRAANRYLRAVTSVPGWFLHAAKLISCQLIGEYLHVGKSFTNANMESRPGVE